MELELALEEEVATELEEVPKADKTKQLRPRMVMMVLIFKLKIYEIILIIYLTL